MPKKKKQEKLGIPKELKKRGRPKKIREEKDLSVKKISETPKHINIEEEVVVKKQKVDYISAIGRRKTSVARIRYCKDGNGEIIINNQNFNKYFPYFEFQKIVTDPLVITNMKGQGKFFIKVNGGGKRGQAESIRHGLARVLKILNKDFRAILKKEGFLTRDSRVKERKKYGLKRARKAPQWQKR